MSTTSHFNRGLVLSRRAMLRGTGVAIGLPWLSAMQKAVHAADSEGESPKRFVAMTLGLGLLADNLNPKEAGRDYTPSRYLEPLGDLREQLTVVSGTSHPGVSGGHRAEASLLTANPVGSSGRAKNTISLDQFMAKHLGNETRYSSLVVGSSGTSSPSYTDNGAMVPALDSPAKIFELLFIDDSPNERAKQAERVREGRSIMDLVNADARSLSKSLGAGDRERLSNYLDSVRELELRMAASQEWAEKPKPKVNMRRPIDIGNPNDFIGRQRLMCSVLKLALETDSTRFVTYHLGGSGGVVPVTGVEEGYHSLSHHGMDEEKLDQLALVELEIIKAWGDFLRELKGVDDKGHSLLEQTSVLLTSNLGNASSHDNRNMPVVLAGGGFKHGQHLAFDRKNNYPLPNLFVSLLQRVGMETDRFASGTSTMTGLEMV
ncbi:MAG: DUF1552 domain-containing protein [Candidatus Moraniibacteriota bacterium]|nr:MAG: DUF1552 domain-containing protein [Candidatus Moranbacteria bacterium]